MPITKILIVSIIIAVVFAAVTFTLFFSGGSKRSAQERELLSSGLPASARILEVIDTGNRFNANPQVRLRLEVQPDAGEAFPAELLIVLSAVDLQKYQPGATIPVRYDPENRARVAIVPR